MLDYCQHHPVNTGNHGYRYNKISYCNHICFYEHQHPQYSVNPDFYNHTGHYTGNMCRCGRVSQREPCMKRDKAGLNCKPDKEHKEQPYSGNCRLRRGISCNCEKVKRTGFYFNPHECKSEKEYANMGLYQEVNPCFKSVCFMVFKNNDNKRA